MQKTDTAELRRLWEEGQKPNKHWADNLYHIYSALPALLDELEAARAELEALKVPLAIYERRTKLIGAAEELERLAKNNEPWPIQCFELKQRAAKLRQEAEDAN